MTTKRCSRCKEDKPVSEFSRQRKSRLGVSAYCKPCNAEYVRLRNQDPDRRAANAARARARRADPAVKERIREYNAAYQARNPRTPAPRRTPEQGTPEWQERTRWTQRVSAAKRQAKRFGAEVNDLTLADWLAVLAEHNGRCHYCGADGQLWIDHMQPLSRGGDNTRNNVVPACEPCNRRKARRTYEQFIYNRCENDHDQTPDLVYVNPAGSKFCRACMRASYRRFHAKTREKGAHA